MATAFNLQTLTEKSPVVVQFKKSLESKTGQGVPYTTIEKIKRTSGVSIRPVVFGLENGQTVGFLFKADGDVFRTQLNGKDLPLAADFDHTYPELFEEGMTQVGNAVKKNQRAFAKRQTMAKVVIPKAASANKVQTLNQKMEAAQAHQAELAKAEEAAMTENTRLKAALEQAKGQAASVGK